MKINISIIDEVTGAGTSESFNSLEAAQVYIGKQMGLIPADGVTVDQTQAPVESGEIAPENQAQSNEAPEEPKEEVSAE